MYVYVADNDVGRPTSKIGRIRELFRKSYAKLQAYTLEGDPSAYNVLGTILGVTSSVSLLSYPPRGQQATRTNDAPFLASSTDS